MTIVWVVFGYSLAFGGRDGFLDELYVELPYRGHGIGTAALKAVIAQADAMHLRAVHLEVARLSTTAKSLYLAHGFEDRERYHLMSLTFSAQH